MFARRFQTAAARQFSTTRSAQDVARMTLLGRVGANLETLQTANGKPYLRYPLAVRTGKDQTSWFNVVTFDERLIEFMSQYVDKGSLVYVEADASIRKYEVDGSPRSSLSLIQQSINPITWKKAEDSDAAAEGAAEAQ